MPQLSLIIPLSTPYLEALPYCLALLKAQHFQDFETLLVNPGLELPPSLNLPGIDGQVLPANKNESLNALRNLGASQAQSPALVFIDPYILPNPKALAYYLEFHRQTPGAIYGFFGQTHQAPSLYLKNCPVHYLDSRLTQISREGLRYAPHFFEHPHWYAWASYCLIPKIDFEALGGFDLRYTRLQGEILLGYQLLEKHPLSFALALWAESWAQASLPSLQHELIHSQWTDDSSETAHQIKLTLPLAEKQLLLPTEPPQKNRAQILATPQDTAWQQIIFQNYLPNDTQLKPEIKQNLCHPQSQIQQKSGEEYATRLLYFHTAKPAKVRPDFIIIGAQKAGTTSLHHYLRAHHRLLASSFWKEMHFFDNESHYAQGESWYLSHFYFQSGKLSFESTPNYLNHPQCPERIAHFSPQVKLIALLRDPVARAYSAWNMYRRIYLPSLRDSRGFDQAMADALAGNPQHGYLERGLYVQQLKRYLDYFPREQILILDFEELKQNPLGILQKTFAFLGLDPLKIIVPPQKVHNRGKYKEPISPETQAKLEAYFQGPNQELRTQWGLSFSWN